MDKQDISSLRCQWEQQELQACQGITSNKMMIYMAPHSQNSGDMIGFTTPESGQHPQLSATSLSLVIVSNRQLISFFQLLKEIRLFEVRYVWLFLQPCAKTDGNGRTGMA